MDRPTRICRCGYLCRLWAVGGERREYTARGNCGQVARHEVPAVRLAGRCGSPGHAVALSLLVQLRDPGLRDFAMGPNGVEHELGLCCPPGPGQSPGRGGRCGCCFSAAMARISPNATAHCSRC